MLVFFLLHFFVWVCNVVCLLLLVAFLTLFERKVFASVQRRKGPERVGIFGVLQPIADALKLLVKEPVVPGRSDMVMFFFAPIIVLFCSLVSWLVVPIWFFFSVVNLNLSILFIFCFSGLTVYGLLLAGWSSNSSYAFLGALRSVSQLISYEICMGLSILPLFFLVGSFNFHEVMDAQSDIWFVRVVPISAIIFFISSLGETNRIPFDLPEAESELVAGYNVEYSGSGFVLFYIAEYLNIILFSVLFVCLFLGGWFCFFGFFSFICFSLKVLFLLFFFIILRASLPRFRYDQLMFICWQVLFPISIGNMLYVFCFFFFS
jgi:NADH-quinone oxidoreductase subunit H